MTTDNLAPVDTRASIETKEPGLEILRGRTTTGAKVSRKSTRANGDGDMLDRLLARASPAPRQLDGHDLVKRFGSLRAVVFAPPETLRDELGLCGEAIDLFALVRSAIKLTRHSPVLRGPRRPDWNRLLEELVIELAPQRVQTCKALFFSRSDRLLWSEIIGRGSPDIVYFQPRQVIGHALRVDASQVLVVRNSLVADLTATDLDISSLDLLRTAGKAVGVEIIDLVIIHQSHWTSLRRQHLMVI